MGVLFLWTQFMRKNRRKHESTKPGIEERSCCLTKCPDARSLFRQFPPERGKPAGPHASVSPEGCGSPALRSLALAAAALCGLAGQPAAWAAGPRAPAAPEEDLGAPLAFYRKRIYGEVSACRWGGGSPAFIKEGGLQGGCSEQTIKPPRPGWPEPLSGQVVCTLLL